MGFANSGAPNHAWRTELPNKAQHNQSKLPKGKPDSSRCNTQSRICIVYTFVTQEGLLYRTRVR